MALSESSRKRGREEVLSSPPAEPKEVPPRPPEEVPPPTPAEVKLPPPEEVKPPGARWHGSPWCPCMLQK
jgi:hypothetical protein